LILYYDIEIANDPAKHHIKHFFKSLMRPMRRKIHKAYFSHTASESHFSHTASESHFSHTASESHFSHTASESHFIIYKKYM